MTRHFLKKKKKKEKGGGGGGGERRLKALRLQFPHQYPAVTYDLLQNFIERIHNSELGRFFFEKRSFRD